MFDLLNNGAYAIFINMFEDPPQPDYIRYFTRVYLPQKTLGIEQENISSRNYKLEQNYPNPFNPNTTLQFSIAKTENVVVTVYNMMGEKIQILANSEFSAGQHKLVWNGKDEHERTVAGGIYIIEMRTSSYRRTIKSIFLK